MPPPNYLNVTFKDSNTWYSGSPYLGYKGTLPTGVVSQNICGEWYFPLHSHALNEFTNYDQGFGGMGTLLRVDPAGGCTAPRRVDDHRRRHPQERQRLGARRRRHHLLPGEPEDDDAPDRRPPPAQTTITVASAAGFPTSGTYYVRVDNEVMQVTGGQGTTTWTVTRGQLGTTAGDARSGRDRHRPGHRLVRRVHRRPGRRPEPQGDLQGRELYDDEHHDVHARRRQRSRSRR